jgi:nucleotide-binding universal stress UspA family protein
VKSVAVSAAAAVSAGHAALHVEVVVVDEPDLDRLSGRLSRCRLLVLGDHGTLGVRAFLLGSTSFDLVRTVGCPVLVVPDTRAEPATTGNVLVGVGTATDDVAVLRVAGQEADRRQAALVVVHSYARAGTGPDAARAGAEHLDRLLDLAGLSPDLAVTAVLTADPAEQALLDHGQRADLIVVGTRGSFALARLANDSVSRHVLDAAAGPVLVVPPGR